MAYIQCGEIEVYHLLDCLCGGGGEISSGSLRFPPFGVAIGEGGR